MIFRISTRPVERGGIGSRPPGDLWSCDTLVSAPPRGLWSREELVPGRQEVSGAVMHLFFQAAVREQTAIKKALKTALKIEQFVIKHSLKIPLIW